MAKTEELWDCDLRQEGNPKVCTSPGGVFPLEGLAHSTEGSERQGKTARERQISEDKRTKTGAEELLVRYIWKPE